MSHMLTRQHPRFRVRLPLICESPAVPGYHTVGFTQNVSRAGLLLQVRQPLAPGTRASLLLLLGDRIARAETSVAWVIEDSPGSMGVRFTVLTGGDRLSWQRFLAFEVTTPRASVRIPIALEAACLVSPDTRLPGRVENLSDGGLMVFLPQALPPRTHLTVAVSSWRTLPPVEAEAEVMWTSAAPEGRGAVHGLRFLTDEMGKELFITGALLRQLLDANEKSPERGVLLLAILARQCAPI